MKTMIVSSHKKEEVIDITSMVERELAQEKVEQGWCLAFIAHTTAALTTADLDPGTDQDMLEFLRKLVPDMRFRHPHNPRHAPDHILSSMIGPSLVVPVENGQLALGEWQRIILVEFDGPRSRTVRVGFVAV